MILSAHLRDICGFLIIHNALWTWACSFKAAPYRFLKIGKRKFEIPRHAYNYTGRRIKLDVRPRKNSFWIKNCEKNKGFLSFVRCTLIRKRVQWLPIFLRSLCRRMSDQLAKNLWRSCFLFLKICLFITHSVKMF